MRKRVSEGGNGGREGVSECVREGGRKGGSECVREGGRKEREPALLS